MNGVVGKLGEKSIRWVISQVCSLSLLFADMNFLLHFLMTKVTLILKLVYAYNVHLQFIASSTPHSGYRREGYGSGGGEEA